MVQCEGNGLPWSSQAGMLNVQLLFLQRARLDGPPVLFCWASLVLHSQTMSGLERGKRVIPEFTKDSCCLSSSLYLASNPICVEIAEKNGYMPVSIPATAWACANKKLYYKYTKPLSGNCSDFFYHLTERWYHWNGNKQTITLHWLKYA